MKKYPSNSGKTIIFNSVTFWAKVDDKWGYFRGLQRHEEVIRQPWMAELQPDEMSWAIDDNMSVVSYAVAKYTSVQL